MSLWLLIFACVPSQNPQGSASLAAELEAVTRSLTDLGPRQVATAQEAQARQVVQDWFADAGLQDVHAEPFQFDAWNPGVATLDVGDQSFDIEALSPSPEVVLTAPLATQDEDFAGAIVLMSSDTGGRADHYFAATLGGAAALVRITEALDHDGRPLVEVGHTLEGTGFPSVGVDAPTGRILEERVGTEATLTIAPVIHRDHVSLNVIGTMAGTEEGTVYVVAHYDSWHPSESAFDNALGVGAQIVLARQLARSGIPRREVVFIATSGEEQGLRGAFAFVDEHLGEIGPEDVVLTLDVLWSGEGSFQAHATRQDLVDLAIESADAAGIVALDGGDPGIGSDHLPFVLQGAEAIWCLRQPDRHYHTTEDTLENLDMTEAAAAVQSQWTLLADLAGI